MARTRLQEAQTADDAEVYRVFLECDRNQSEAARRLKKHRTTVQRAIYRIENGPRIPGVDPEPPPVELPPDVDDDLPVEELIQIQRKRFRKRKEHHKAKQWFPVKVNIDGPIGLSFFGDPHVDDNACDWDTLWEHCDIHRRTEGLFGANVGDTTNNWVGRLLRLYADQDTSISTARKYADWLLNGSGVQWLVWALGNHDVWNEGDEILRRMNGARVPMEDWQARFTLKFPGGRDCRIWLQHDFPGNSLWNSLHGPQRAAHTKAEAHIYACGHKHNWALHQEESASRHFTYWLLRARGYKDFDPHQTTLGHESQAEGQTITAVIDPASKTEAGFVQCFVDMAEAADFLKFKRRRK